MPKEATQLYYPADRTVERLARCDEAEAPFFHRTDFLAPMLDEHDIVDYNHEQETVRLVGGIRQ